MTNPYPSVSLRAQVLFSILLVALMTFGSVRSVFAQLSVADLRVEYLENPLGLETRQPRLSWKIQSSKRNTVQRAYEIRVAEEIRTLSTGKNISWNSTLQQDSQSIQIPYSGTPLQDGSRYYWQVRVRDNYGRTSKWSAINFWQMGMKASSWTAKWISAVDGDTLHNSPLFRKTFSNTKTVKAATAYITAKGLYEASINGQKIGDRYFAPGWTSYAKRLQYQVYDVTSLLKKGDNVVGAVLGDGWYRGNIGFANQFNFYGTKRSLLLQLSIEYTDGTTALVQTDESWHTSYGPIISSDIYGGEQYDSRLEKKGWATAAYVEDASWKNVTVLDESKGELTSTLGPPVKKHEVFKALKIFRTPKGELVADFGQNLVGWLQIKTHGAAGTTIKVSHAEVLDKEGNFYTANLRSAKQQNSYILDGRPEQVFEPHFTFQGFRYIKLEGMEKEPALADLNAVALYSDMPETGTLTTDHPLLNQLQHNIQWGQKGNFLDVPTDCPQRDERLGWTGDAQAFYQTAAYNMDVSAFFSKWMKDVSAEQLKSGAVTHVVPNVLGQGWSGAAGWGDVSTIIPWGMYTAYGDQRILEEQYDSMKGWVDYMTAHTKDQLWNTGSHFGDWLFYRPEDDNDGRAAVTDKHLIAQTFYAHSTQILVSTATLLGKKDDAAKYSALLSGIKAAFMKEYATPNGRLVSGTQTAYVLALQFDLFPENLRAQAAERLANNVHDYGNHLTTGFLGTPYLCHVLSRFGYTDVAYQLLLQESYPSWLYPVKKGATTIWERWDGIKEDGTFQTVSMNSFNHYAYGAIGDWMYRNMAGIKPAEGTAGYKSIVIAPQPGGNIRRVAGGLDTPYGLVKSSWRLEDGLMKMEVVVPVNTTATIVLPKAAGKQVRETGMELIKVAGISAITNASKDLSLKTGSGTYHFEYKM
ncbi:rhamnosidase A [Pedobacter sp. BAL39]|uniref:glycoside hydrolase family 78 protein n=1 Tax=Pedobacter sp. BAL39 TaxID=391596 RepID=UPI0001559A40|nr:glycoside hydrolase family 78 protein [Pedobacter sp. BAL39]EDM35463.1 rhamnosidase A [Pedobacter sp. BAL39]